MIHLRPSIGARGRASAAGIVRGMAVFLRKLLRIGKLPSELREAVEAEGILHFAEYVPVTRRFTGKVPGMRSGGSVDRLSGSLVFTSQRVLGTLSTVPKLAGRAIDLRWDTPPRGPVIADISSAGLVISLDVGQVDPRCSGQLSLHYKEPLSDDVLERLPRRTLAYEVPPEFIFRAVGVPYHP